MHSHNNLSKGISQTTTATSVAPSILGGGLTQGFLQFTKASRVAIDAFSKQISEKRSLIAALEAICHEENQVKIDSASLDLFPELKEEFASSMAGIGNFIFGIATLPFMLATHVSQLPVDLSAAMTGLIRSTDYQKLLHMEAFTLNVEDEKRLDQSGLSANCLGLLCELNVILDKISQEIDLALGEGTVAKTHQFSAKTVGSSLALGSVSAGIALSMVLDLIGSKFREITGIFKFCVGESHADLGKNIYQEFSICCESITQTNNCRKMLVNLQNLEVVLSNFAEANEQSHQHSITLPIVSVALRLFLTEPFVSALRLVNSIAIANGVVSDKLTEQRAGLTRHAQLSLTKASVINTVANGGLLPSQNMRDLTQGLQNILAAIDAELAVIQYSSDAYSIRRSAATTVTFGVALSVLPFLMSDVIGLLSRELSGIIQFYKMDAGTKEELKVASQTRDQEFGADCDRLMTKIFQLQERLALCRELAVSAPLILGMSQSAFYGSLCGGLNTLIGFLYATNELRSLAQSPSQGTRLNVEEIDAARELVNRTQENNRQTGAFSHSDHISEQLSMARSLESVANKIILFYRSQLNCFAPHEERHDINGFAKSTIFSCRGNLTGFLSGSLGLCGLIGVESGMSIESVSRLFLRAFSHSNRALDGLDATVFNPSSKTNLSFLSNTLRLMEKETHSVFKTSLAPTRGTGEILFSRAATIFLCHSGILTHALKALTQNEEQQQIGHVNESTLQVALVMDKLAAHILNELNRVNANHQIPHLNQDMAQQIASLSKSSIANLLTVHTTFIMPFLQARAAFRVALQEISPEMINEAVIESMIGKQMTQASNVLQAYVQNCIHAFQNQMKVNDNQQVPSSVETHLCSEQTMASNVVASCCLTLLMEEIFSIAVSRSLLLLDRNRITADTQLSSADTKAELNVSFANIAVDSDFEKGESGTQIVSALRLILSRLGQCSVELGTKLYEEIKDKQFLQNNLVLHSTQKNFLKSLSKMLSNIGVSLLQISGVFLSMPLTIAGVINELRECINSIEIPLETKVVRSSADSTQESTKDSESCSSFSIPSLLTGTLIDSMASILLSLAQLLFKGSTLALDTLLSVAKALEIVLIDPHPIKASQIESEDLSLPQRELTSLLHQKMMVAGSSVTVASLLHDAKTHHIETTEMSMGGLQVALDRQIEVSVLSDDELKQEEMLNFKEFIKILMIVLNNKQSQELSANDHQHYDEVLKFLDWGLIYLHQFHSSYKNILLQNKISENSLLNQNQFLHCNDALSLIELFIRRSVKDIKILNHLRDELLAQPKRLMSAKTLTYYNIILQNIQHEITNRNLNSTFFGRKVEFNMQDYKNIFLESLPLVDTVIHVTP